MSTPDEEHIFPITFPVETDLIEGSFATMFDFASPRTRLPRAVSSESSGGTYSYAPTDLPPAAMDHTPLKKNKPIKTKVAKKSSACKQKNQDRPKRALSAYNIFFATERKKMLAETPVRAIGKPRKSHGKVGFSEMAKRIGEKWKNIDPQDRLYYEGLAAKDKWRYNVEMGEWTLSNEAKRSQEADAAQAAAEAAAIAACVSSQPSVHVPVLQGSSGVATGSGDPLLGCFFNDNLNASAFDDTPLPIVSGTFTVNNTMPVAMSVFSSNFTQDQQQQQQQQQQGGNQFILDQAHQATRDYLRQLQQAPSSHTMRAPVSAASLTNTNRWEAAPVCISETTRSMYNLSSSSSSSNITDKTHTMLLSDPTSLHHADASTYVCNSNNNTNNDRESLERLARNMHRDCVNLFVDMFRNHDDTNNANM